VHAGASVGNPLGSLLNSLYLVTWVKYDGFMLLTANMFCYLLLSSKGISVM